LDLQCLHYFSRLYRPKVMQKGVAVEAREVAVGEEEVAVVVAVQRVAQDFERQMENVLTVMAIEKA
jgi:hypothetical protein